MSDELDAWAKQPAESARAYSAFREYRDLGPSRTVDQLRTVSATAARRWSRLHRWVERAQAWDVEAWRIEDTRRLEAIRAMDQDHLVAARALMRAGLQALAGQPALTPHQAARFVDLGARLQRAALLGEHLPAPGPPPVEVVEEMSPLERIARELAGTA